MAAERVFARMRRTRGVPVLCVASRTAGRNWPIKEDKQRALSLIGGKPLPDTKLPHAAFLLISGPVQISNSFMAKNNQILEISQNSCNQILKLEEYLFHMNTVKTAFALSFE